jgi:hypothetical protein
MGKVAGDERTHAVKPTVNGRRALCGAGLITTHVPGRFDAGADAENVCPECIAALPT